MASDGNGEHGNAYERGDNRPESSGPSPAFMQIIFSLCQQHEHDLAEAVRRVRTQPAQQEGSLGPDSTQSAETEETQETQPQLKVNFSHPVDRPADIDGEQTPSQRGNSFLSVASLESFGTKKKAFLKDHGGSNEVLPSKYQELINERLKKSKRQDSTCSNIVKSARFAQATAFALLLNAFYVGMQVDMGGSIDPKPAFLICDYAFCVLFILELSTRLWAYGVCDFFTDLKDKWWNTFDFFIIALSAVDVIVMTVNPSTQLSVLSNVSLLRVTRMMRIVRVVRIIRVMKFFQDLRVLLAAIVSTVKTTSFALLLILLIIYMFGVGLTQFTFEHFRYQQEIGEQSDPALEFFFGSVPSSLLSLFMTISGGIDWKDALIALFKVGWLAPGSFIAYVLLMTLCIMNVLFGIFCQCALDAAAQDKENAERDAVIEELMKLFASWDKDGSDKISMTEFKIRLAEGQASVLSGLQIPAHDAIVLFELLDVDNSGEIDLDEFVTGCIMLRAEAKSVDRIENLSKLVEDEFGKLKKEVIRQGSANSEQVQSSIKQLSSLESTSVRQERMLSYLMTMLQSRTGDVASEKANSPQPTSRLWI